MVNSAKTDAMKERSNVESLKSQVLQVVERNEQAIILIAQSVLDIAYELKHQRFTRKPQQIDPLDLITNQLEDYIQLRCSTCSVKERLQKIEDEEN